MTTIHVDEVGEPTTADGCEVHHESAGVAAARSALLTYKAFVDPGDGMSAAENIGDLIADLALLADAEDDDECSGAGVLVDAERHYEEESA